MELSAKQIDRVLECYRLIEEARLSNQKSRSGGISRLVSNAAKRARYQFLPYYHSNPPSWRVWLRSKSGRRVLPDFACMGAVKCGTSDLAVYLFQHPSILTPLTKEIHSSNPADWRPHYPTEQECERVRREHGSVRTGFFEPGMHSVKLMDSFKSARPDAKILITVRDPVERAYSHFKWDTYLGGKGIQNVPYYKSFAAYLDMAFDLFPYVVMPSRSGLPLLATGIYFKSVEQWIARFGRENVSVVCAEDYFRDVSGTIMKIHEFLGLPPIAPRLHPVVNQNPIKIAPLDDEVRQRLVDFYRPHNQKLYDLIGQDFGWG